jgi:ferrous-iron efflux pump FieF
MTNAQKLRRYATYASTSVALTLIVVKFFAYIMTDSVAMLSSFLDSVVDLAASLITLFSVNHAMQPPDREHRFGHGKAEPLAALAQSGFVFGSALLLCNEAVGRLFNPAPLQNSTIGFVVMVFAILLTYGLTRFQKYVIRHTESVAIDADHFHYAGDILINTAVILSLGIQRYFGITWVDPLFAFAIAGILLSGAWRIGKDAYHILMDRELPEESRETIRKAVLSLPHVVGVHDLRTRSDSERIFVEIHVELPPEMPLQEAHDIAEQATKSIHASFPTSDVIVHLDPAGHEEKRLDRQIEIQNA